MKALLLIFGALFFYGISYSQLTWSSGIPTNPQLTSSYSPFESVMYNNDVYQVYDGNANNLQVSRFDSETGQWSVLDVLNNPNYNYKYRSAILGDKWYIVVAGTSSALVFKFDFATESLTLCPGSLPWDVGDQWIIKNSPGANEFYLAYAVNDTDVYMSVFDGTTENFNGYDYTPMLNASGTDLSSSALELYLGNSDVWVGVSGAVNRLVKAQLTNLSSPTYYNVNGTNDGYMRLNSAPLSNGFYYLTGDGQTEPYITVQSNTTYQGYEEVLSDVDVNINTSTTTANTFYTWQNEHESLEHPAYAFLVSPFSTAGSGSNYDKFYVYQKDNGTNVWDSLGPKIEFGIYDVYPNSLRLSLENSNQKHMAVTYGAVDGEYFFKVLNNKPSIIPASETTSSSMCGGHVNLIYPQLEIEDPDMDHIRILSVSSTNGNVQNAYAVPIGVDNTSSPGVSKFAIYGFVQTQGNTQIQITYTDGWNVFNITLNSITIVGTAPSIIFDPALSHLCSNEMNISLPDYVNYFDNGTFSMNGQVLPNGIINGIELSATQPSGSFTYDANVDGCIVSTGSSYNFVMAGTASVNSTPATCGATDGSATVIYSNGTSSTITVEWSTGENTPTINNLGPGAYYYHVTDEYGCHVTGFGGVETAAIDVSESITNASCYGANDGSIGITVTGPASYSVIWSNGYSTPSISNLEAGQYWVTVQDISNSCQVTYNYTVTQPDKVIASFSEDEPTCGSADGSIYGIYSGGSGSYTYEWLGTPQTTADLYNVAYGNYQVVIHDLNGCKDTFNYDLNEEQALSISEIIYPTSCIYNTGAIQLSFTTDPDGGTAFPSNIDWSNGAVGPINGSLATGMYSVVVTNAETTSPFNECHSIKSFYVPIKAPTIQPICIVTVDSATTSNLVIWERTETYGIHHYNIYRENTEAGAYSLIDTVNYTTESIFNDVVASPMDRSWRYRISQVNDCGIESPLSLPHKTLHLNAIEDLGNGTYDVLWDDYEGYIDASEYQIWRNSDQNGWELLPTTVPVGTTSFTDTPSAGLTGIDYYVKMVTQTSCTAEKVQDFNTTRSNKEKGNFIVGQGTGDSNNELSEQSIEFSVYPNPVTDELILLTELQAVGSTLHIIGLDGVEHFSIEVNDVEMVIELEHLSQGIYLVQIDNSEQVIRLVKN